MKFRKIIDTSDIYMIVYGKDMKKLLTSLLLFTSSISGLSTNRYRKPPTIFKSPTINATQANPLNLDQQYCPVPDNMIEELYLRVSNNGSEQNMEKAKKLFTSLAKKGHALSQYYLAVIFNDAENYEDALKWFEKAAKNGIEEAFYFSSYIYQYGMGVIQKDELKALNILFNAILRGDRLSVNRFYNLQQKLFSDAELYLLGKDGFAKNIEKARELFQALSKTKYGPAQYKLAELSYKDAKYDKALSYCSMAMENGDYNSLIIQGAIYYEQTIGNVPLNIEDYKKTLGTYIFALEKLPDQTYQIKENIDKILKHIYEKAKDIDNQNDAMELYKLAAERDHAKSQYELAFILAKAKDLHNALEWCEKVILGINEDDAKYISDALILKGDILLELGNDKHILEYYKQIPKQYLPTFLERIHNAAKYIQDKSQAKELYKLAAENRYSPAQLKMGTLLMDALPEKNITILEVQPIIDWFKKADKNSHKDAQHFIDSFLTTIYDVSTFYSEGSNDYTQNHIIGQEFLTLAAENGHIISQCELARLLIIDKNYNEAESWVNKIIENQFPVTEVSKDVKARALVYKGDIVSERKEYKEAFEFYHNANETLSYHRRNNPELMISNKVEMLSQKIYEEVLNVKYGEAQIDLLSLAANNGHTKSQFKLAELYKGMEKYKKAIYYYEKAIKNGHINAIREKGILYQEGLGVERNMTYARELWQKASEKGDDKAKNLIEKHQTHYVSISTIFIIGVAIIRAFYIQSESQNNNRIIPQRINEFLGQLWYNILRKIKTQENQNERDWLIIKGTLEYYISQGEEIPCPISFNQLGNNHEAVYKLGSALYSEAITLLSDDRNDFNDPITRELRKANDIKLVTTEFHKMVKQINDEIINDTLNEIIIKVEQIHTSSSQRQQVQDRAGAEEVARTHLNHYQKQHLKKTKSAKEFEPTI